MQNQESVGSLRPETKRRSILAASGGVAGVAGCLDSTGSPASETTDPTAARSPPTTNQRAQPRASDVRYAAEFDSIQAAIDDLPTRGGIVQLPLGEVEIQDPPIVIEKRAVTLRGHGVTSTGPDHRGATRLVNTATDGTDAIRVTYPNAQLRNFVVEGNPDSGSGVVMHTSHFHLCDRVVSSRHGEHGFLIEKSWHGWLYTPYAQHNGESGFRIQNPGNVAINMYSPWALENERGIDVWNAGGGPEIYGANAIKNRREGIRVGNSRGGFLSYYTEANGGHMDEPAGVVLGAGEHTTEGLALKPFEAYVAGEPFTGFGEKSEDARETVGLRLQAVHGIHVIGGWFEEVDTAVSLEGADTKSVTVDSAVAFNNRGVGFKDATVGKRIGVKSAAHVSALNGGQWASSLFGGVGNAIAEMERATGTGTVLLEEPIEETVTISDHDVQIVDIVDNDVTVESDGARVVRNGRSHTEDASPGDGDSLWDGAAALAAKLNIVVEDRSGDPPHSHYTADSDGNWIELGG